MELERRYLETRYDQERRVVHGYAAVFYDGTPSTEYQLGPNVFERIHPNAFDQSMTKGKLAGKLKLCRMHDRRQGLASQPKTLRVEKDTKGIKYDATIVDTTAGRDAIAELSAGLLTGASVGMDLRSADVKYTKEGARTIATVMRADLHEISLVDHAAYEATTAVLRWADEFKAVTLDEWEKTVRDLLNRSKGSK